MFEEDDIKPFSIINLSIVNSVIAIIELFFLNSIRRPTVSLSPMLRIGAASLTRGGGVKEKQLTASPPP